MLKGKLFLAFLFISFISFAQVQRTVTRLAQKDADSITPAGDNKGRREMLRELQLTREQQVKMKTLRDDFRAKQDAVNNNDKLTADERKSKLRELRKEHVQNMMLVLNEEQRKKMGSNMKEIIKKKKEGNGPENN